MIFTATALSHKDKILMLADAYILHRVQKDMKSSPQQTLSKSEKTINVANV